MAMVNILCVHYQVTLLSTITFLKYNMSDKYSLYLTKSRIRFHSLLHPGLWLAACPVKPQRTDLLSPIR